MVPFRGHQPVRVVQPFREHPPVVLYQPVYRGNRPGLRSGYSNSGYSRYRDRGSYGGFGGCSGFGRSISFSSGSISIRIVLD